jgi:hypothetical protein
MVLTTAFNVVGYIGAPLALGVLDKNKRIIYAIVFVMLCLLLSTLPMDDFIVSNIAITSIIVISALIQFKRGENFNIRSFFFIIYLWLLMLLSGINWAVIIISLIFYFLATSEKFVLASKKHQAIDE